PACSVCVERSGLSWRLTGRELDGEAGFDLGELARREDRLLAGADAARVAGLLGYPRVLGLAPVAGGGGGVDGTSFVLEGAERGRYHVVTRDDPEWGDTFGEFGALLIRLAGFTPR